MIHELRHAARRLRRSPAFSLVAVATLAVGIGASTAIFSVLNAALLRPLPFVDAHRLVMVWETMGDWRTRWVAPANFIDWREQARSFQGLAGFSLTDANLTGAGDPERIKAGVVSASFFDVLGVRAA